MDKLGRKRILLTDDQRRVLAVKGKTLNRKTMMELRTIVTPDTIHAYLDHYHRERNHQGLDNQIIGPGGEVGQEIGEVQCRERLGGMLRYYYRDAA